MTDEIQIIEEEPKTTKEAVSTLRETDWYQLLKDDIDSDLTETEFDVNNRIIELYHRLGQKITENIDNFKRANVYGQYIAQTIGEDIGRHPSVVRRAVQFYQQEPDLQKFLSDKPKNLSWTKIRNEYLPSREFKKIIAGVKNSDERQIQKEINLSIAIDNMDKDIFTFRDNLELFIDIRGVFSLIVSTKFASFFKNKFKTDDIKILINEFIKGKTEKEIKHLKELETEVISTIDIEIKDKNISQDTTLSKDSRPTMSQMRLVKEQLSVDKPPLQQLVSQYKELYKSKYKREPSISSTSWGKWGRLLKMKLEKGYTINEVISLLQIFAKSKDSDNLAFDPGVLLSDFVFNKMLAMKSKNSNPAIEGKYAKF